MSARRIALITVVGAVVTTGAARATQMSWSDALVLAAISIGAATAVGLIGWCLLVRARRRSVGLQAVVVVLAVVAAVAAGVLVSASQMFINDHDLESLLVILPAAGTVGVLAALTLGHRVGTASRSLADLLRRLEDGGRAAHAGAGVAAPGELAALAEQLASTQARLAESQARAQAVEASRRELVAWVSHDLRTPLSGIRAMVEALEDGLADDPDTVARYYRTMRMETVRLARLVDDLFELSRIGAEAVRLSPETASLSDLVSDALAGARPAAETKAVRLTGRVVRAGPSVVLSTPEFSRVLRNLLDNAIRHTPPGGEVTIDAGFEEASATVTVHDACGGIPVEELQRVFEVAYRGDAARSRDGDGGAGLGLAIARGLIEAHQGEIVVGNHGPGCAFTVRIPLDGERRGLARTSAGCPAPVTSGGATSVPSS